MIRRENLNEARFSCLKIYGKDFSKQNLVGADFSYVKAGISVPRLILLFLFAATLASISGAFLAAGSFYSLFLLRLNGISISGIAVILSTVISIVTYTQRGLFWGLAWGVGLLAPFLVLNVILTGSKSDIDLPFYTGTLAIFLTAIGFLLSLLSVLLITAKKKLIWVNTLLVTTISIAVALTQYGKHGLAASVFIIITSLAIGYTADLALSDSTQFFWILQLGILFSSIGGTSFQSSDLTDADFSGSLLNNTDFRKAVLIRTCFAGVKGLERSRFSDDSYLANSKARRLAITLDGREQNFDGMNLQGVNLRDADLQSASFIGTNLNQANLRGANLSRAKLKQTQLDEADLTGAILTGAFIEDWGITGNTQLDNVTCDYVFMRLETKDNPNRLRKPDNWRETFRQGEFSDFIKPYVDTLDLYHSQDVDPRSISIALKNLSDNHPEEKLEFVAIERRGNHGLNLRFTTAPGANKSELSHEYFANYDRIRKELPISVQLRLAEQDAEIRTLKGTIEQFIQTGTHQSTVLAETIQVIQGELVMTENKGININAGGNIGDISGLVGGDVNGVINLGAISGNVTNTINQLPDTSESDQLSLKDLLTQLQQAIEDDDSLPDPDKADLLEQVQVLAEAKQTEEPVQKEGLARKAMKMFDATLKSLPDTARIVEACSNLLPLILKALGLPA